MRMVLLLEEDREAREAFAGVLRNIGYVVLQAASEAEALHALRSPRTIDLVLAGATEHDRLEFIADLRDCRPSLPAVFLADFCEPESRLRGLAMGAFTSIPRLNLYLNVRPVAIYELSMLLRSILNGRRAGRRMQLAAA